MLKHCLAQGGADNPYRLWLHEYVPGTDEVYVEGIHNHRYPLVSMILRGGYRAREFRGTPTTLPITTETDLNFWSQYAQTLSPQASCYETGAFTSIPTTDAHQLHDILPGTLTLAVELPATRSFSVAFDGTNGAASKIVPSVDQYREALLGNLLD